MALDPDAIRALTFDVFGTVVDWRSTIAREVAEIGKARGVTADWAAFADAWRAGYQPAMEEVRAGAREWVPLDVLHREILDRIAPLAGLGALSDGELRRLNLVWHRLDPWPDAVAGLDRLAERYTLATLSNGNVDLLAEMAAHAGLRWHRVLGAEPTRSYKPMPECYLGTARLLGLEPRECLMVAAHNGDLRSASALGFRTAFVSRPTEHGPRQGTDLEPWEGADLAVTDLGALAEALGC